jgi:hypothetical protein
MLSRFMAKVALEAMAARVVGHEGGQDYLCDEHQLDDLRDHARHGRISRWPVHTRHIYAADAKTVLPGGESEQVIHESDFLVTVRGMVFCFGNIRLGTRDQLGRPGDRGLRAVAPRK